MMSRSKQMSLLLLGIAGVLTLLLAMSLPDLILSPGQPFSLGRSSPEVSGVSDELPGSHLLMYVFQGILALVLILFPFYVLFALLNAESRRRLLANVIVIVLLLLLADFVRNLPREESAEQPEKTITTLIDWGQLGESNPTARFSAQPPQELTLVVILAVSVLIVALIGTILWFFARRRKSPVYTLEKLAEEVQKTIVSIRAGDDFKTNIIRCYQEMSQVLREERGIAREKSMTPREFEYQLINRGLPHESIQTLTRLFEQARYSSIPAGTQDKNLALACLNNIVDACKAMSNIHDRQ